MPHHRSLLAAAALSAAVSVALLGAGAGATSAATTTASGCKPGVGTVSGVKARVFCGGTAKATIRVGARTFTLTGGSCEKGSAYLAVNIGTVVLEPGKHVADPYFGVALGKLPMIGGTPVTRDGPVAGAIVSARVGGVSYAFRASSLKVALSGGRSKGTFSGDAYGGPSLSGSFSC